MAFVKIFVSWPIGIGKIILTLKKVKCMKLHWHKKLTQNYSLIMSKIWLASRKPNTKIRKSKFGVNIKAKCWTFQSSFEIDFLIWNIFFYYSLWIYSILSHCGNARARWRNRCFYASRYVAVVSNVDRVLARIMQGKVSKESGGSTTPLVLSSVRSHSFFKIPRLGLDFSWRLLELRNSCRCLLASVALVVEMEFNLHPDTMNCLIIVVKTYMFISFWDFFLQNSFARLGFLLAVAWAS